MKKGIGYILMILLSLLMVGWIMNIIDWSKIQYGGDTLLFAKLVNWNLILITGMAMLKVSKDLIND